MQIKLIDHEQSWWCDIPLPEDASQLLVKLVQAHNVVDVESDQQLHAKIGFALTTALLEVFDPKHKLPTARQLYFADEIAKTLGLVIPPRARGSRKELRAFISAHVERYRRRRFIGIELWDRNDPYWEEPKVE